MIKQVLPLIGSLIFLILGGMHLFYTFFSNKFSARNPQADVAMQNTSPRLTSQTTMWRAWLGFNGSHSLGVIFFAVANIILVLQYFPILQNSYALQILDILTSGFYVFLAKKYWFKIPLLGTLVAFCCFFAALYP